MGGADSVLARKRVRATARVQTPIARAAIVTMAPRAVTTWRFRCSGMRCLHMETITPLGSPQLRTQSSFTSWTSLGLILDKQWNIVISNGTVSYLFNYLLVCLFIYSLIYIISGLFICFCQCVLGAALIHW